MSRSRSHSHMTIETASGSQPSSARAPPAVQPPHRGDPVVSVAALWPDRAPGSNSGAVGKNAKSPASGAHTPFEAADAWINPVRTGAEEIVAQRPGPLGNGLEVQSDHNVHASGQRRPVVLLPECCEGAQGLKISELIRGHIPNVTLPSRLALLGRQGFETIAALRPITLGNAVLGFAPVLGTKSIRTDLYVLPWIFSKGGARIWIFLRFLLLLVFLVFAFQFIRLFDLNIGRAWLIGSSLAIYTMWRLALIRRAPDGVMAFCRSMGAPEIEEYMFSYSWKVEPEAVRTLAKAVWNNNVGVWIDVVKLCPGDEIRPMVRTMCNRVYRCVVFLSPAYIASPNCCVELHEAVQWPEKLLICILEPVPQMEQFLAELETKGAVVVRGFKELIAELDAEICDVNDAGAWKWWRKQKITATSGVPEVVVPSHWHTIPRFKLVGKLHVPSRSLTAGPVYLAGDCSAAGLRFMPPYLFLLALVALAANFIDLYYTFYRSDECPVDPTACHETIDYVWLGIIAACNLAPFTSWSSLFDTRTDVHPVLRPLLASKSMNGGVKISVVGHDSDPIVQHLNAFLTQIGHNARDRPVEPPPSARQQAAHKSSKVTSEPPASNRRTEGLAAGFSHSITIYVMRDFAQRDALFGREEFAFEPRTSLFVWSDPKSDPFTKDEIGERLMRFLVLVAAWDRKLLAENLFSAIGVRVVDMLHSADLSVSDDKLEVHGSDEPSRSRRSKMRR